MVLPVRTSVLAGLLAALGSGLGKLSFDGSSGLTHIAARKCAAWFPSAVAVADGEVRLAVEAGGDGSSLACTYLVLGMRAAFAVAMLAINGVTIGVYVRSMQEEGSVVATVINVGSSFVCTGLLGFSLFGEALHPLWFLGASIIAIGVFLVAKAAPFAVPTAEDNKEAHQNKGD